jgi:hypothetical protein
MKSTHEKDRGGGHVRLSKAEELLNGPEDDCAKSCACESSLRYVLY